MRRAIVEMVRENGKLVFKVIESAREWTEAELANDVGFVERRKNIAAARQNVQKCREIVPERLELRFVG